MRNQTVLLNLNSPPGKTPGLRSRRLLSRRATSFLNCDRSDSASRRSSLSSPAKARRKPGCHEGPMRNIWIIAKREFDHFFISPIAYVVAFMILLTTGIIFFVNILYFIQNAFQSFGQTPDIGPITGAFGFLLVLSIPAI